MAQGKTACAGVKAEDRDSDGKGNRADSGYGKDEKKKGLKKNERTKLKEDKKMNIKLTKTERLLLCGGLIGMASLLLQACDIIAKEDGDTRDRICGNWVFNVFSNVKTQKLTNTL